MPRIPTAADLPQGTGRDLVPRAPRAPQQAPPAAALFEIGQAVATLGQRLTEQRRDAERAMAVSDLTVILPEQIDQRLVAMQTEAAPGAKGFTNAFMGEARNTVGTFLEGLRAQYDLPDRDFTALERRGNAMLAVAHSAALRFEDQERRRLYADSVSRQLETASASAFRDTTKLPVALAQMETVLANATTALSPEQLVTLRSQYDREIRLRHIQGRIRDDPIGVLAELRTGALDHFVAEGLASDDLVALEEEAIAEIKEQLAIAEAQEQRAEKAIKEAQEARTTELRIGILEGKVGQHELISAARRREISDSQFNGLLSFAKTPEGSVSDEALALDLLLGIHRGEADAEDVMAARERLSPERARSLLDKADEVVRRGSILARFDVQQERDRLDQTVGGVRGSMAVLDFDASERVRRALDEFDQRVQAGEPSREVADDLIMAFRRSPLLLKSLARPRFFEGIAAGKRDDLIARALAAERRTTAALDAREIDEETAAREFERIDAYLALIEQMEE